MFETVCCPSCSSRYGLRLHRVKSGIKRARCFRCKSVFGIEVEVLRLLKASEPPTDFPDLEPIVPVVAAPVAPVSVASAPIVEAESPLEADLETDGDVPMPEPPIPAELEMDLTASGMEAALSSDAFDLDAIETATTSIPDAVPSTTFDAIPEPAPSETPDTLTLGDLDGVTEEILEKTLVVEPQDLGASAQDVRATLPDGSGSYASAKDAISRLLGEGRPEPQHERRAIGGGSTMDVEAALDALDNTLGGNTTPKDLAVKELAPKDLGTKPTAQPAPFRIPIPEPPVAKPMNSTVKLSHDELMAAMAAATAPPAPQPVTPRPLPAPPISALPPTKAESQDQNLYKVQLPKETQHNVSLDVLTMWIEQGRVQEFHMVARQQSEHWIEAGKVPALRMVFDRIKRAQTPVVQQSQANLVPPPSEAVPQKKGIFGGLFGRG